MATVWAAHVGAFQWKNDPAKTGWSHLFAFESLSDLVQQMFRLGPELPGQVTKLGIVAHGDRDGDVRLEVSGGVGMGAGAHYAGDINAVDRGGTAGGTLAAGPGSGSTILTEYSWYSKWSYNGQIIRLPKLEQGRPQHMDRTVYGIKAVNNALQTHSDWVKHLYFENDGVRAKVPRAERIVVRGKVAHKTRAELTGLAGTSKHEGVVLVWEAMVLRYRCADPECPGHHNPWDFCQAFAGRFPNGPLK